MGDELRRLRVARAEANQVSEPKRVERMLDRLAAASPRTHDLWARMPRRKRIAARVRLFLAYGVRGRMVIRDELPARRGMSAVKR